MSSCSAPFCNSVRKSAKRNGISFHEFPSNFELREKWINAVMDKIIFPEKFWHPGERASLCSLHFTPDCFKTRSQRKILIPGAVPTIFQDFETDKISKTSDPVKRSKKASTIKSEKTDSTISS